MISEWESSAPSNIALIKYMGKNEAHGNLPANSSLSYTLENFRTFVVLKSSRERRDEWFPLKREGLFSLHLSEKGKSKFLAFFSEIKKRFEIDGFFTISSANNFPSDCGLASSASSFAALTQASVEFFSNMTGRTIWTAADLSRLSRQGSGSSCRSFFQPWALWRGKGAEEVTLSLPPLLHLAVVVEAHIKEVSSSEAHRRVTTSELFEGRVKRAERRLQSLLISLEQQSWKETYELVWNEFWDMHALFETSRPPFSYMTSDSFKVLEVVRSEWKKGDGPLITMDAGANVHLLYRRDQRNAALEMKQKLSSHYLVLCGAGDL